MTETKPGVLPKKMKLWNPALDDERPSPATTLNCSSPKSDSTEEESLSSPSSTDCNKPAGSMIPTFLQNYMHFHFLRMQQHQMEMVMRQRMLNAPIIPQMPQFQPPVSTMQQLAQRPLIPNLVQSAMPSNSKPAVSQAPSQPMVNPLVVNAVGGSPAVSENCCAVCGTSFRLTGDLVQHMRNNHRRTRFKRKNERQAI